MFLIRVFENREEAGFAIFYWKRAPKHLYLGLYLRRSANRMICENKEETAVLDLGIFFYMHWCM